jgi:FAD/FMN-containing dehydrogenase
MEMHCLKCKSFRAGLRIIDRIIRKDLTTAFLRIYDSAALPHFMGVDSGSVGTRMSPEEALVLVGFEGVRELVEIQKKIVMKLAMEEGAEILDRKIAQEFWEKRHKFGTSKLTQSSMDFTEEFSIPFSEMETFQKRSMNILKKHSLRSGGAGAGRRDGRDSLNEAGITYFIDERDEDEFARYEKAQDELVALSVELGGAITAAHGVGLRLVKYMQAQHGSSLNLMRRIKQMLDPYNIMNPDKVVPAETNHAIE